jgi:hypothetical protein
LTWLWEQESVPEVGQFGFSVDSHEPVSLTSWQFTSAWQYVLKN